VIHHIEYKKNYKKIKNRREQAVERVFPFHERYIRKYSRARKRETVQYSTAKHSQPRPNVEVPMHRHTAPVIRCNSLIYVSKQRHENVTLTFDTFTDNGKTLAGKSSDALSLVNDDEKKSKPVMKCDVLQNLSRILVNSNLHWAVATARTGQVICNYVLISYCVDMLVGVSLWKQRQFY